MREFVEQCSRNWEKHIDREVLMVFKKYCKIST
jgi:hypothetical protein